MDPKDRLGFPFTVRDMLAFQHGAAFSLRITSQSTLANILIIRGMTSEGSFAFMHTTTGDSQQSIQEFRMTDVPIWVTVMDKDGTIIPGQTYITLSVVINGDILFELCSGLVYRQKSISWPYNNSQDMRPLGGQILSTGSSNPAAGAEASLTVPSGQIWRLIAMDITLVNAATAGSRRVHFEITMAGNTTIHLISPTDQIISETKIYSCANHSIPTVNGHSNDILVGLPANIFLRADDTIETATVNLAAGDNFGALNITVEQFFDVT